MSTRFTQRGIEMVESRSLRLVFATAAVRDGITDYVARTLVAQGYAHVSPSMLSFLGALDCGVNYGSEIARNLEVSRQMVAKTVKELCHVGYLEQVAGPGRQKQILFTAKGERLMADVRRLLARLDQVLAERTGEAKLRATIATLEVIHEILSAKPPGSDE
jgi:DNA-binding MarR family transcriptional regulator